MTQILNRWNGNVIIEGEMNLTELVIHAVKTGASLDDASLDGAFLDGASLNGASLNYASLSYASLNGASLNGAYLNGASLNRASLNYAYLNDASLNGASLDGAFLDGAFLDGAFLDGANIDYTGWPLRCSSLTTNVCDKIAAQLLFHAFAVARINPTDEQITFIRNFHRFDECGGVNRLVKKP